jgi:hypothetical protein
MEAHVPIDKLRPGALVVEVKRYPVIAPREILAVPVPGLPKSRLVTCLAEFEEVIDGLVDNRPGYPETLEQLRECMRWAALNKPQLFPVQLVPPNGDNA